MSDQIRCPHCGEELKGMARIMIETAGEVVDFQTTCSSCGKMIRKKDIIAVTTEQLATVLGQKSKKKWWQFWK